MEVPVYSDHDLFELVSQDDPAAFSVLFDRYYDTLARVLTRYSSDSEQVKDWIQEVYLRLWENRHTMVMEEVANARAYFIVSARNHVVRELSRKKQVHYTFSEQQNVPEVADNNLEEQLNHHELWKAYDVALLKMPPRTQETYYLNRELGLSYGKVAHRLGISVKTVESQMARALSILRHELVSFIQ
jgi:RNA polymerase sigma-70 factor, ECF subfamily